MLLGESATFHGAHKPIGWFGKSLALGFELNAFNVARQLYQTQKIGRYGLTPLAKRLNVDASLVERDIVWADADAGRVTYK